jgi:hypothetical protein
MKQQDSKVRAKLRSKRSPLACSRSKVQETPQHGRRFRKLDHALIKFPVSILQYIFKKGINEFKRFYKEERININRQGKYPKV